MRNLTPILVLLLFIISCSSEPKPSPSELKNSLSVELPAYIEVSSYSTEAAQNAGTKVEPIYQTRFKAVLSVKSDTYVPAGRDSNVLFVNLKRKKGDTLEVFGKSKSRLYAGKWTVNTQLEGSPLGALGKPLTMYSEDRVIVKGTKQESDYYKEIERIKKEKIEAAKKEAERRASLSAKIMNTIMGKWKTEFDTIFEYHKDGTFTFTSDKGKQERGRWRTHDGKLILIWPSGREYAFDVVLYSDNVYKLKDKEGTYTSNRL